MPKLLYFFTLCNLIMGTSVFVLGSVVAEVGEGLGVSAAAAGQGMTMFALSTALLSPWLLIGVSRWARRDALFLAVGLTTLGGVLCALAPSITWLYVGRAIMGLGAIFGAIVAALTMAIAKPEQRGRALSTVFAGTSLSYVIGIPLGSWLASAWGWRETLGLLAALTGCLCLAIWFTVPKTLGVVGANLKGSMTLLKRGDVLAVLAVTLLYMAAIFTVFSYVAPVLRGLLPGLGPSGLTTVLTLFGIAGFIGSVSGGFASDHFGPKRTLLCQQTVMLCMMCLLPFLAGNVVLLVAALMTWGIAGFGMMSPQQARLAAKDLSKAPLLLSLNTSMIYLGISLGAIAGGAASGMIGFARLPWVAAGFMLLSLSLLWVTRRG